MNIKYRFGNVGNRFLSQESNLSYLFLSFGFSSDNDDNYKLLTNISSSSFRAQDVLDTLDHQLVYENEFYRKYSRNGLSSPSIHKVYSLD